MPYVAGKGFTEVSRRYGLKPEEIVKLGSNENPYGPSPKVAEALQDISPERYPEPEELMAGLAGYTGFPEEMIVIGAGMDGVMDTLTRLFLEKGDQNLHTHPHLQLLRDPDILKRREARLFASAARNSRVPMTIPADTKMAFLCSPNNPTGNVTDEEEVRALLESTDAIVFLDEAYVEFAEQSLADARERV